MVLSRNEKILWVAWCINCKKALDMALDGTYIEHLAKEHTRKEEHTVLVSMVILPAKKVLDRFKLPCKYASHTSDSVPMPFGSGNCSMDSFECVYDGEIDIPEDLTCNEDNTCPAYAPIDVEVCRIHLKEYWDCCDECYDAMEKEWP
jgi:hypothetical protein